MSELLFSTIFSGWLNGTDWIRLTISCEHLEGHVSKLFPAFDNHMHGGESAGVEATENRALDALFAGLTTVVKQAASELGCYATEEAIVSRATKKLG